MDSDTLPVDRVEGDALVPVVQAEHLLVAVQISQLQAVSMIQLFLYLAYCMSTK